MATLSPTCSKCGTKMEEGFILEKGSCDHPSTNEWIEGKQERSFWFGLKLTNREHRNVKTFRCEECGYLESYAW